MLSAKGDSVKLTSEINFVSTFKIDPANIFNKFKVCHIDPANIFNKYKVCGLLNFQVIIF